MVSMEHSHVDVTQLLLCCTLSVYMILADRVLCCGVCRRCSLQPQCSPTVLSLMSGRWTWSCQLSTLPVQQAQPSALTQVCFCLPFGSDIGQANKAAGYPCSRVFIKGTFCIGLSAFVL